MIRMIRLVESNWGVKLAKQDLIVLEFDIICTLDYNVTYCSPPVFIERYVRLMDIDERHKEMTEFAKDANRTLLRSHQYTQFSAGQMAAAALTYVINICSNQQLAESLQLPFIADLIPDKADTNPFSIWTS